MVLIQAHTPSKPASVSHKAAGKCLLVETTLANHWNERKCLLLRSRWKMKQIYVSHVTQSSQMFTSVGISQMCYHIPTSTHWPVLSCSARHSKSSRNEALGRDPKPCEICALISKYSRSYVNFKKWGRWEEISWSVANNLWRPDIDHPTILMISVHGRSHSFLDTQTPWIPWHYCFPTKQKL